MNANGPWRSPVPAVLAVIVGHFTVALHPAAAQTRSFSYDRLSFLEERLATEVGDVGRFGPWVMNNCRPMR